MIRVLLVGKGPPDRGGIAAFLRALLSSRLVDDYDVSFLNIAHTDMPEGGKLTLSNAWRTIRDTSAVWRAAKGHDVVHIHSAAAPGVTMMRAGALALAGRSRGCHVLLHAHGGRVQLWLTSGPRRMFARIVFAPANTLIAASEGGRAALARAMPPHRVRLIDNGVDGGAFRPAPVGHDPPRVLYVGLLTPRKGVVDLLTASRLLHDRGIDHELWLVGGTPDEGPAAEAAVRAADDGRARFCGVQLPDAMATFYREGDIFCLPSWWEAMPLSLLEAMASGLAVVVTDVGDMARIVGATGVVVPARAPTQLASAIEQLLREPRRARAFGAAARERVVDLFSFDRTLRSIESLYEESTGSARGAARG